jgi:hypothetical protein
MCGCFDNYVGVLVMCTCIYCVFVLFRLCIFILIFYKCKDYCHRGKTQLQYIIIIIIIIVDGCLPIFRDSLLAPSSRADVHSVKKVCKQVPT